jgi:plastocyanin
MMTGNKVFGYIAIAVLFIASLVLSGCAQQSAVTSSEKSVRISDFTFSPATITVAAGTAITWTNEDPAPHSIISDRLIASPTFGPGKTFEFVFTQPGTYEYHCGIHPSMKGTVIVQ